MDCLLHRTLQNPTHTRKKKTIFQGHPYMPGNLVRTHFDAYPRAPPPPVPILPPLHTSPATITWRHCSCPPQKRHKNAILRCRNKENIHQTFFTLRLAHTGLPGDFHSHERPATIATCSVRDVSISLLPSLCPSTPPISQPPPRFHCPLKPCEHTPHPWLACQLGRSLRKCTRL